MNKESKKNFADFMEFVFDLALKFQSDFLNFIKVAEAEKRETFTLEELKALHRQSFDAVMKKI